MNLSNAAIHCLYPIYNWLAWHNAPLFILDLFLPILTTTSWEEALIRELEDGKTFETFEEFIEDLKS